MESKYSAALCRLVFLLYAKNPYVVSILFNTDVSVHHALFTISACSFVRSRSMEFYLCLLYLFLKRCLFLREVLLLFCIHLICDPTEIIFLSESLPLPSLFFTEALVVLLVLTFFALISFTSTFFLSLFVFCFDSYYRSVVAIDVSSW